MADSGASSRPEITYNIRTDALELGAAFDRLSSGAGVFRAILLVTVMMAQNGSSHG